MSPRPHVHVIALGGTIAMTATDDGGVAPSLSVEDLLGSVGEAPDVEVSAETFAGVPSAYLTVDDLLGVARRAHEALADGAHGVVVVQGTDTLEETSFVVDLVHGGPQPIVFTGAMRHPESLGADGPANLRDAIVAAAGLRDTGTLVCMGSQLHAARFVTKAHAFDPAAFVSPQAGPVGWVAEQRPTLLMRLPDLARFDLDGVGDEPHPYVALHRVTLGDDGTALRALAASNPAGVVLEAFGAGHVHPGVADVAEDLSREVPVVLATRTGGGTVLTETYGYVGSEKDLLARGLISAGRLIGSKARLLLGLSLRVDDDAARRERFAAWTS